MSLQSPPSHAPILARSLYTCSFFFFFLGKGFKRETTGMILENYDFGKRRGRGGWRGGVLEQ